VPLDFTDASQDEKKILFFFLSFSRNFVFCHSSAQVHCYKVCKCAATLKLLGWGEYWWLQAYGVQPLFCGYFASEFSTQAPYSVAIS